MNRTNLSHLGDTRRNFIKQTTLVTAGLTLDRMSQVSVGAAPVAAQATLPWYRRTLRWGQTNITEIDPARYDIAWWRKHWKRTHTQGVIINAGGIVAYYPSRVPFHRQAQHLGGRDLFGELCRAAHEDGLAVFARMDSNRADEECYGAHPDWFAVDAQGRPHKAGDLFITCINGPYYEEHIPAILREITEQYHPEGFTDNSWSGLSRDAFCHCDNCRKRFRERMGRDLPKAKDWNDFTYREWIRWNYDRRLEIWDLNNRTTKAAGGPDCIWAGMNSGRVLFYSDDQLKIWDPSTDETTVVASGLGYHLSSDGRRLFTVRPAVLWDLESLSLLADSTTIPDLPNTIADLRGTFSPDSRWLALSGDASGDRSRIIVLDAEIGAEQWRTEVNGPSRLTFSDNRSLLFDSSRTSRIWDVRTGKVLKTWNRYVSPIGFSSDGMGIWTGDSAELGERGMALWDIRDVLAIPRILAADSGLEIHWDLGTLQYSPTVNGPWTDLPAASPFPLSPIGDRGFFRIKVE